MTIKIVTQATPQTLRINDELPTNIYDTIEIGNYSFDFCTQYIKILVTVDYSATLSICKKYYVPLTYNATNNIQYRVMPFFQRIVGVENFDLLVKVNNGTAYFYILRTAGTTEAGMVIDIELKTTDYNNRWNHTEVITAALEPTQYRVYETGREIFNETNTLLGGNRRDVSDWPDVFNAPIIPDPLYNSLQVRYFPNYPAKDGDTKGSKYFGRTILIPAAMTNIIFTTWTRCTTPHATNNKAAIFAKCRNINSGAAPSGWTTGTRYAMTYANNAYYQKFTDSHTLADVGLVADRLALISYGRNAANGFDTIQSDIYMASLEITFS